MIKKASIEMEMTKSRSDAFRVCLPPVTFGNNIKKLEIVHALGEIRRIQFCVVFGRDLMADVGGVGGFVKFE